MGKLKRKQKGKHWLQPFWLEAEVKSAERNCFCFHFLLPLPCKYFEALSLEMDVIILRLWGQKFGLNLEGCCENKSWLLNPVKKNFWAHIVSLHLEVYWKHGSTGGSRSAIQIFLEAEAEAEAKRHHFHITEKCNGIFYKCTLRTIVCKKWPK